MTSGWKKAGANIATAVFWILIWKLVSVRLGKTLLLPAPEHVLQELFRLVVTADFWKTVVLSMLRVLTGIAAAMAAGILLAVLTCVSRAADQLLAPIFLMIRATPVASFTILILLWIDRGWVPVLIAGLMVFPVVWANVSEGIRKTDSGLLEMAKLYHVRPVLILRQIYLPSVRPYFISACRSVLGFGWKAGIAAEVLTVPKVSIGRMIFESKLYLMTTELFAWTAAVILLSLLMEKIVLRLFGGRND